MPGTEGPRVWGRVGRSPTHYDKAPGHDPLDDGDQGQAGNTLGWRGQGPLHSIRQHYIRRHTVGGINTKVTKVKSQVLKVCFWGRREVGTVSF